jgi:hypothetical protein
MLIARTFGGRVARTGLVLATAVAIAACATPPPKVDDVIPFSVNRPGGKLPRGWQSWVITRTKAPTTYDLVVDPLTQRVVVHAIADRAATGLKQRLDIAPDERPLISWNWRVVRLIKGADNTDRYAEDAPVRLMLFFDGDTGKLPAREQIKMETARVLSGQPVPYATLMYIWENRQTVGKVIPNAHTTRVRMVVAGSGTDRLGQWKNFERNYVEDFRKAFNEAPGRLIGVGILTDTDNTGESVEAFYGDIELRRAAR